MKKEYYTYTPLEVYQAIRANRRDIAFDGFPNKVYFDENEYIANIHVSSRYEVEDNTPLEEGEEREPTKPVDELDIINAKGNYVYRDAFTLRTRNDSAPDWKLNPFTGLDISFYVGEGILDFCYTDFTKEQDSILLFGNIFSQGMKREDIVHNRDEVYEVEKGKMEKTLMTLSDYIYQSVYSSIFPPYIAEFTKDTVPTFIRYITEVQKEMMRRIEFVFDDEFYPDELSKFLPCERYSLYADIYGTPLSFNRDERFTMLGNFSARPLKHGNIDPAEIVQRLTSHVPTDEQSPLEQALGLKAGKVQLFYHVPRFMAVEYSVSTLHDMLELEFTKMLEYGTRLHKCKICGRYFIVKGNYVSDFCNRIRVGQTRTCQQIGAQRKYDEKLKTDEATALFRKYYKRYYARTKVNQIKPDKFREWNYRACEMRDRCQNGEITAVEFEEWLYNSFKNRKKKE
ncbi:DUF6076 domain-containing protein [Ruminococcus sp.]|uniref:DUF6076 domain-containing protein n=1 Tax=Ruminococcus sp. TaxID=41978 RepID=UPI0025E90C56|nr:DUF6076 domain-containing protein [Ruminococcus sp.]MBQ9543280.1 hypothetical protein [Ruminococcus sp.]